MPHGPSVYYDANTGYLVLGVLTDAAAPDTPITTATVTCEWIKTLGGVLLTGVGVTFPIAMPHTTGGNYRCVIPETLVVIPETMYEASVKAVNGTSIGNFYLRFPARRRVV